MTSYQITGDSPEAVAYALMQNILYASGRGDNAKPLSPHSTLLHRDACGETDILSLYERCLNTVRGEQLQGAHGATARAA